MSYRNKIIISLLIPFKIVNIFLFNIKSFLLIRRVLKNVSYNLKTAEASKLALA